MASFGLAPAALCPPCAGGPRAGHSSAGWESHQRSSSRSILAQRCHHQAHRGAFLPWHGDVRAQHHLQRAGVHGTPTAGWLCPWDTAVAYSSHPFQVLHCTSGLPTFPTSPLKLFSQAPFWVLGAQGRLFISWVSPPRDKSSYHVGVRAVASLSVCNQTPCVSSLPSNLESKEEPYLPAGGWNALAAQRHFSALLMPLR